ncbi:MAG: uncharacterized protein A8A55_0383 [Amphiamblys sp. WSBS2006]|nr:MAG: uncharacterized protein A8A55_0383 [Amphiamblys sp. WSBS2006]
MEDDRVLEALTKVLGVFGNAVLEINRVLEEIKSSLKKKEEGGSAADSQEAAGEPSKEGAEVTTDLLIKKFAAFSASGKVSKKIQAQKKQTNEKKFHYAYHFFQKEAVAILKQDTQYKGCNMSRVVATMWRELEDKTKYKAQEEESRREYEAWIAETQGLGIDGAPNTKNIEQNMLKSLEKTFSEKDQKENDSEEKNGGQEANDSGEAPAKEEPVEEGPAREASPGDETGEWERERIRYDYDTVMSEEEYETGEPSEECLYTEEPVIEDF